MAAQEAGGLSVIASAAGPKARRPGADKLPWKGVLIVWLVVAAIMLVATGGHLGPTDFPDGDDALRLQQVRDLLAGQGWFDLTQHRIAPPAGVAMHWTRVVDVPIAALILMLRPVLGTALAESVTVVLIPLLTLLCAMLLNARLARQQVGTRAAVIAAVLTALAIPASFRMAPLRIDHHGWQFVLALVALNGMAARNARVGGAVAGGAIALALATSLESLPLAVIFAAVCGLRLLRDDRVWLSSYLTSLALGALVLFAATRGLSDLVDHCDALSPVHIAVLLFAAGASAVVLPLVKGRPPALAVLVLGVTGLGCLAILGLRAPQCLGADAFAAVDPLVRKVWLASVAEGLPVWRQSAGLAVTMIVLPLFGMVACSRLWHAAHDRTTRAWWSDMALLLAGTTLVGLLVARASGVSCLFAAVPAAWQFEDLLARWSADRLMWRRMVRVVLMVLLAVPGAAVGMAQAWVTPQHDKPLAAPGPAGAACDLAQVAPMLAAMQPTTVLAGMDIGPALLVASPHKVVATPHHRASGAIRDLLIAFLGPDAGARRMMHKYGATLVMICPGGGESSVYRKLAPDGFMAHLMAGRAPDWMTPIRTPTASGVKMWRVVQPSRDSAS